MGDKTGISWTDATWNPIRGCRRTAPAGSKQSGCGDPTGGGCYAERQAARFCGPGQAYEGLVKLTAHGPRWTGEVRTVREHLMDPLHWRRPRRIFTDSMSDLFFEGFEDWQIDQVVAVMMISCLHEASQGHVFQTLTKRPARMRSYFSDPKTQERVARAAGRLMEDGDGWLDEIYHRKEGLLHPRIWWGTSVENQAAADERIPEILATPAAVRFLSCEPLIGGVDLGRWLRGGGEPGSGQPGPRATQQGAATPDQGASQAVGNVAEPHLGPGTRARAATPPPHLSWVIAGCESGPGARPCDVAWFRSLRDQCAAAAVPFFLKQAVLSFEAAGRRAAEPSMQARRAVVTEGPGSKRKAGGVIELPYLDGLQHAAFPEVP